MVVPMRMLVLAGLRSVSPRCFRHLSSITAPGPSPESDGPRAQPCFDEDKIYTSSSFSDTYTGPVQVKAMADKGHGLCALQRLQIGQLILADQPLSILHGAEDEMPEPDSLIPMLRALPPGPAAAMVGILHQGPGCQRPAWASVDVMNTILRLGPKRANAEVDAALAKGAEPLGESQLEGVVAHNAFGDMFEDLASHSCRGGDKPGGDKPTSHVGVWPRFAMLNHSCLPNAVHYVVGSTMVVRACRQIEAGEEVNVSYLGRVDFSPAPVRQQILEQRYSFKCKCPRCRLESSLDSSSEGAGGLLRQLHSDTTYRLAPMFTEAVEGQDMKTVEAVAEELDGWSGRLFTALDKVVSSQPAIDFLSAEHEAAASHEPAEKKSGPDSEQTLPASAPALGGPWHAVLTVEAAVYDYLELLYMVEEVAGRDSAPSLKLCSQVMDAVSRGSELHVYQTAQMLARALATESPSEAAVVEAAQACELAHLARYGNKISRPVMAKLIAANKRHGEAFL